MKIITQATNMMTDKELDEIEQRADRATPGPWYWRAGKHTGDKKTSDAGGLHTKSPVESFTPDGRRFLNENVVFPAAKVGGEPYWVEKFMDSTKGGKPTLSLALECFGKDEDKEFIARAREDIPALVSEICRLRKRLADLGIQEP
jgi:hypothetical protein